MVEGNHGDWSKGFYDDDLLQPFYFKYLARGCIVRSVCFLACEFTRSASASQTCRLDAYMSYRLNQFLKGGYIGDYVGKYFGG